MRLLVVGGLHGNEPLGISIVAALHRQPVEGIDTLIGNPEATRAHRRFIDLDLNRVFPGDPSEDTYEMRRAYELQECLDRDYDLIIDFHNTHTPDNDCGLVGDQGNRRLAAEAARFLGLSRLVVAEYDCINRYAPNCLSVEMSLDSPDCRADVWLARLRALAAARPCDLSGLTLPVLYRFGGRIARDQADGLVSEQWRAFRPIPKADADALGLPHGSRAIFIEDAYTPWNFAAVVHQLDPLQPRERKQQQSTSVGRL